MTTEIAITLLETAAKLLREQPDTMVGFCRENDLAHGTGVDMAIAALGAVHFIASGAPVQIVDDAPEGD